MQIDFTNLYSVSPVTEGYAMTERGLIPLKDSGIVLYARPLLIKEIIRVYWNVAPIYTHNGQTITRKLFVPPNYIHLCGTENYDYLWPKEKQMPEWLANWLATPTNTNVLNLGTLLKRAGMPFKADFVYRPEMVKNPDLGFLVIDNAGDLHGCQVTLLFEKGSFFKGTVVDKNITGLDLGFYGGLKHPGDDVAGIAQKFIAGNIISKYAKTPWEKHISSQWCEYAGLKLKPKILPPKTQDIIKAAIGLPTAIKRINAHLLRNWYARRPVNGWAGQVCPMDKNIDADVVIVGNVESAEFDAAIIRNPALPINKYIPKIKVKTYKKKNVGMHEIYINKRFWNVYTKYLGGDFDGDGVVVITDPDIVANSVSIPESFEDIDINAFKSSKDVIYSNWDEARTIAIQRLRENARLVGIYDLIARRIIWQNGQIENSLAIQITQAIQASISARKKPIYSEFLRGTYWIRKMIGENINIYKNNLDKQRKLSELSTELNKKLTTDLLLQYKNIIDELSDDKIFAEYANMYKTLIGMVIVPDKNIGSGIRHAGENMYRLNKSKISPERQEIILPILFGPDGLTEKLRNVLKAAEAKYMPMLLREIYDKYCLELSPVEKAMVDGYILWRLPFIVIDFLYSVEHLAQMNIFTDIHLFFAKKPTEKVYKLSQLNRFIPWLKITRYLGLKPDTKLRIKKINEIDAGIVHKKHGSHSIKYHVICAIE